MNTANLMAIAILLLTVLPSYAAGETTIPYIEIQSPADGQTVGNTVNLVVVAKGYDLKDPVVSISGEQMGIGFPLNDCIYEASPEEGGLIGMYCNTEIDLGGFEGQNVRLGVTVTENQEALTDSVGLFVSGQCV